MTGGEIRKRREYRLTKNAAKTLRFERGGEVLDQRLTDKKAIKRLIKDWQPDQLRA